MEQQQNDQFVDAFSIISRRVHDIAVRKGFWDAPRNDSEMLMLSVTELAEACEALRHGNPPDDKVPEFSGAEAEMADCVIRLMDQAAARGYRLAEAIIAKTAYNEGRPYKHGKNF